MSSLTDHWSFLPRYHLANGLMRASLAVMPACRVRDELKALLAAYRAGCEAVVLLDAMKRLDFFTGEPMPVETVEEASDLDDPSVWIERASRRPVQPRGADGLTMAQRSVKISAAARSVPRIPQGGSR